MPLEQNETAGLAGTGHLKNGSEPIMLYLTEHLFDCSMRGGEECWHILSVVIQAFCVLSCWYSQTVAQKLMLSIPIFDGIY